MKTKIGEFVKLRRRQAGLTQEELSYKAGVGLRFIRDVEQGVFHIVFCHADEGSIFII